MRRHSLICLGAQALLFAACAESGATTPESDTSSAADSNDGYQSSDGSDTADTADGGDAGDGTDSGDAADGTNGSDAGDATDATDSTDGSDSGPPTPLDPPVGPVGPRTVGADAYLSCAITSASQPAPVACWGQFESVVLSTPAPIGATPKTVQGLDDAVDLSVSTDHVCAVRATGAVACWGFNHHSQLGLPNDEVFHPAAANVAGVSGAVQVSVGGSHTCALLADGSVMCWGMSGWGQLGTGNQDEYSSTATPTAVPGVDHGVKVVSGGGHSCALRDDQTVMCWGFNPFGEVGTGTSGDYPPPTVVKGVGAVRDVAMNNNGTWLLGEDGTVWYLGTHSSPDMIVVPAAEQALPGSMRIDGNYDHACVTNAAGAVQCWSYRPAYQWGTGLPNRDSQQVLPEPADAAPLRELSVGLTHSCGRTGDGLVQCWGAGEHGQLGPFAPGKSEVLETPALMQNANHVAAHYDGTCASTTTGAVWCWGENSGGRLGLGLPNSVLPRRLDDLNLSGEVDDVTVGPQFSCAVAGGKVTCWGSNTEGQLGTPASKAPAVVHVPDLSDIVRVVAGEQHACALQTGGAVACWGNNALAQLGRGTLSASEGPAWVTLPAPAVDLAAGENHTCAALVNGEAWCWGLGKYGQLGEAVPADPDLLDEGDLGNYLRMYVKLTPQKLPLTDVVRIAASGDDTCATHSTGVTCYGKTFEYAETAAVVSGGDLSATRLVLSPWGGCRLGVAGAACHGNFKALGAGEAGDVLAGARSLALGSYACVVDSAGDLRCYSARDVEVLAGTLESSDAPVPLAL